MELLARTCKLERMNVQRILARVFVIIGGLFWIAMAWGADWIYEDAPLTQALGSALLYAAAVAAVFVIGLFYEYVAAAILAVGAVAIVIAGVIIGWESGVWMTVALFFLAPMVVAAVLYYLAARMQAICSAKPA